MTDGSYDNPSFFLMLFHYHILQHSWRFFYDKCFSSILVDLLSLAMPLLCYRLHLYCHMTQLLFSMSIVEPPLYIIQLYSNVCRVYVSFTAILFTLFDCIFNFHIDMVFVKI